MTQSPSLGGTFGALFIGWIISTTLYGLACSQAVAYFRRYIYDHTPLKLSDTLGTELEHHGGHFGNELSMILTCRCYLVKIQLVPGSMTVGTVQYLWIMRVWTLSQHKFRTFVAYFLLLMVVTDWVISLTWLASVTNSLVNKLIIYGVNTSFIACVGTVSLMLVTIIAPRELYFIAIFAVLPKLYLNTYLAMLNWRRVSAPSGQEDPDGDSLIEFTTWPLRTLSRFVNAEQNLPARPAPDDKARYKREAPRLSTQFDYTCPVSFLTLLMSLRPLIAVCGTTGVGKSKLAVELALSLFKSSGTQDAQVYHGARIINADAMQVYEGLDIITNKVSTEEQCGVEHLLMGFKKPGEQYVVAQWVRDALKIIDETHQRNQVPIIVGGTSYWIQHLIFPHRLATSPNDFHRDDSRSPSPTTQTSPSESTSFSNALASLTPDQLLSFQNLPKTSPSASTEPDATFALHHLLASLDPVIAQRWHWKDSRKVLRSLEIMQEHRRLASELIREQSAATPPPRFRTLCLWLYSKPESLSPRLNHRVDEMLQRGLLQEVATIKNLSTTIGSSSKVVAPETDSGATDFTLGIYQSIGYREFHEYLDAKPSDKEFQDAVERMKISTRQYAKRQVSWLRNKLLPATQVANTNSKAVGGSDVVPTFLLDASDFLKEKELPNPLELSDTARDMLSIPDKPTNPNDVLSARRKLVCHICTVNDERPVMIEEGREWKAHVKTRVHRRMVDRSIRAKASAWTPPNRPQDNQQESSEESFEGLGGLLGSTDSA
ncbi:hypothetical protein NLI96_g12571 [Meripilus lineatus]|uniref:DUF6534 domain-containing protein n=1 Tax=Meripilus lineatus TaxID=2056292 RepID=A0AAD5URD5_9APHY|nr:hypothetical protein NLI96_g12571 [Physisporinus lineatus]